MGRFENDVHLYEKCIQRDTSRMMCTYIAEAPWSAAEWAVALLFVELLQAQLGRQVAYLLILI